MTDTILDIRNVTKSFGGLKAVNDVSFKVRRGELLGIAGPNGSGKSTLFNVLTRIPFSVTKGEVWFEGQRIDRLPPHKISTLGLARTFQKDAEFPDLNARDTIALAAVYGRKLGQGPARSAADQILAEIGFSAERANMPTTEISVYERKQLMIGSALVMQPKVLMLDEPASGLTKPEIADLHTMLMKINAKGITILLIEHVLSLLLSVAERLIVLNQGKLLAEGSPNDVIKRPNVIEAFLGGRTA